MCVCVGMCAVGHVWSSESSMEVALLSYHVDPVRSQTRQITDVYHIKADLAAKFSQHPSVLPVTGLWLACPLPNLNLSSCSSRSGPPHIRPFWLPDHFIYLSLWVSWSDPFPRPTAQLSLIFPLTLPDVLVSGYALSLLSIINFPSSTMPRKQ